MRVKRTPGSGAIANIRSTATCACPAPINTTSLTTGCITGCMQPFPHKCPLRRVFGEGQAVSQRAGTKPGDDIVALGREEVPVTGPCDPRTGGEASSAQHLARVEPGLRIVFVRIRCEARKRHEIRGRPFPHIADHLSATASAVADGTVGNIERSVERKSK